MVELGKLTREEEIIKLDVLAKEQNDPLYRTRVKYYFGMLKARYDLAVRDLEFDPHEVQELAELVRVYGKVLGVIVKMDIVPQTKLDAFQEADIAAQSEEASKLTE